MGVAQHHRVNLPGIEREVPIALGGFLAMALEQTAFHEQPFAIDFEQVHGPGGGARRAEKMDFHGLEAWRVERENAILFRSDFNHRWAQMNTGFKNRKIHGLKLVRVVDWNLKTLRTG
jgi:hypothetical protein